MRRSSWPRPWRSCGGQVSPCAREGESARGGGAVRGEAERRAGISAGPRGERGGGATPGIGTRRCEVAFPRRRRVRPSAERGGRSESASPAAPRPGGSPRSPAGPGPGRPHPLGPVPALPAPAGAARPAPQDRGLVAGGGKRFLSSSQPRQDRGYLAEVAFLCLCFRSLGKAHFSSSRLGVTRSGRSAGCQPVPGGGSESGGTRPSPCRVSLQGRPPRPPRRKVCACG